MSSSGTADSASKDAATARPLTRARTGAILLSVIISELLVIGLADNQWISDRISRARSDTSNATLKELADSWLTFRWSLSPGSHSTAQWGSELGLIATVLVISALVIYAVVRGPITFGRAFFGAWTAVLAATVLGAFVRGLIWRDSLPNANALVRGAYGPAGPIPPAVAAGVGLGLFVALVAALVAVASRRTVSEPVAPDAQEAERTAYVEPEQPPPFYGDPVPVASSVGSPTSPSVGSPADRPATAEWPGSTGYGAPVPAWTPYGSAPAGAPPAGSPPAGSPPAGRGMDPATEQTSAFPRIPAETPHQDERRQTAGFPQQAVPLQQPPWRAAQAAHSVPQSAPQLSQPEPQPAPAQPSAPPTPQSAPQQAPQASTDDDTSQIPRVVDGPQPTTRFPRPPDDDDLGHFEPHA